MRVIVKIVLSHEVLESSQFAKFQKERNRAPNRKRWQNSDARFLKYQFPEKCGVNGCSGDREIR